MADITALAFASLALFPAALNPSLNVRAETMSMVLCAGGARQSVEVPVGDPVLPGTAGSACCAKGTDSRRRLGDDESGNEDDADGE